MTRKEFIVNLTLIHKLKQHYGNNYKRDFKSVKITVAIWKDFDSVDIDVYPHKSGFYHRDSIRYPTNTYEEALKILDTLTQQNE